MLLIPSTIGPPTTITIVFRSPTFSANLTTITGVSLAVTRQNGTTATWAMTIVSATEVELVAQYAFVGGEIDGTGPYNLAATLTNSDGSFPAQGITAFVGYFIVPKLEDDAWLAATAILPPGVGAGGGISFAGVCTLEQFGAKGNDLTHDRAAWIAALAALDLGTFSTLLLGAKTYLIAGASDVATTILSNNDISIIGWGHKSRLKTAANAQVILAHHTGGLGRLTFRDFTIEGDWDGVTTPTKTNQNGIEVGYNGNDGAKDCFIENVTLLNLQGRGISHYAALTLTGPITIGCRADKVGSTAFYAATQSIWSALSATGCPLVATIGSGNTGWYGCDFTQNVDCFFTQGGGNGAHGSIVGGRFNHNTGDFFRTDPAANGFSITGVHVYEAGIHIVGTAGNRGLVRIDDSTLDLTTVIIDGGDALLNDCTFDAAYFVSVTTPNNGELEIRNPRALNGSLPAYVGDIVSQSFTFPSNANQIASKLLSRAGIITLKTGSLTSTKAFSLARDPADGETQLIANTTNQSVDCYWADTSGSGVRVPAGETLLMGASGVDATCILMGSNAFTVAPPLGGGGTVDPTTLPLTSFFRDYSGGAWAGTTTTGTSASKTMSVVGSPPTTGTPVGGHTPASFSGSQSLRDTGHTATDYISLTKYRAWFLVDAASLAADAGAPYLNAGLLTESTGEWGAYVYGTPDTAAAYHDSGGYKITTGTISTGSWVLVDIRYDGTTLTVAINGVDGVSVTAGTLASAGGIVILGSNFLGAVGFIGDMLEAATCDDDLPATTPAMLVAYVNNRYGLSL